MEKQLIQIFSNISNIVWGPPLLILLVGTGVYLTVRLGGVQFKGLGHALYLGLIRRKEKDDILGDINHFQALMTALAATVGTGNIAGVATAIASGGPGALFWMWITGLFGMATKYAEAVLAVKYRVTNPRGEMSGGPMYYLSQGLNAPWLGVLFAIFAAVAAFGIGNMVQSNSVSIALESSFGLPAWITGILLAVLTGAVLIGGIKSIGKVTGYLVPLMIVLYVLAALIIVLLEWRRIPEVFALVFGQAFSPTAAAGGFLGATVREAVRFGVARGVFSNESGLGSSPIAAAAAKTSSPPAQALVSMTQTFIDTIIVCSMTGFVILVSGAWKTGLTGAELTTSAFSAVLPGNWGGLVVTGGLTLFAYSTVLGWSYYGEKSIEYLLGVKAAVPYRLVFTIFVLVGALTHLEIVWSLADIMNGFMAFPNLIGLLGLSGIAAAETRAYFSSRKSDLPRR
jgi:AGCS family alanine or glycine:cation symporter